MDHPIEAQWELQDKLFEELLDGRILIIIWNIDGTRVNEVQWDERLKKYGIKAKDRDIRNWFGHYDSLNELIEDQASDPYVRMIIDVLEYEVLYSAK